LCKSVRRLFASLLGLLIATILPIAIAAVLAPFIVMRFATGFGHPLFRFIIGTR
jgi:hypothetical protein